MSEALPESLWRLLSFAPTSDSLDLIKKNYYVMCGHIILNVYNNIFL